MTLALTSGLLIAVVFATAGGQGPTRLVDGFRPPSVPLVVVDPYLRYVLV